MIPETVGIPAEAPCGQHRCICCGKTIEMAPDKDVAVGLNLALGLVSDECALICNDCTLRLITTRQRRERWRKGRRRKTVDVASSPVRG